MAALLVLRRRLIIEHQATTAEELILIDSALIAYHHQLRLNGWIGNLALLVEHDFFGSDGPRVKLREHYGPQVEALQVEERLVRIGEQLLPLLDRSNRLLL